MRPRRLAAIAIVLTAPLTVHFDVALDQDGEVVDDLTCRLIERISAKEGIHASHI